MRLSEMSDTELKEHYKKLEEEKRRRARIQEEMLTATGAESKALEWQYFNLPDEIMATQWAVNYAKEHPKKIKKMWKKAQSALLDFYKKNGVLDDLN